MILRAHGMSVDLPDGWEGRIFRRRHGDPTLHAGTFALPQDDGEFGSRATAAMPPGCWQSKSLGVSSSRGMSTWIVATPA